MNSVFRLKMAKQKGEALLKELGITRLPVDPFAIAASRDIVVDAKPDTADGVSGMLLRPSASSMRPTSRARGSSGSAWATSSGITFSTGTPTIS